MKIEKVRMSEIRPSDINKDIYQATHEEKLIKLANDIKRNGLIHPLVVSSDGVIISGHTRYKALTILGRKFVEIIRSPVHSSDPEFARLLIAANNQREKTDQEKFNELAASIDPAEYARKSQIQAAFGDDVYLEQVRGELKADRYLSDNYDDLVDEVVRILEANTDFLPMSLRGVHYLLLNTSPIVSKRLGERYQNDRRHYKILSDVVTKMRVNDIIPFHWIRDDTRKIKPNRGYKDAFSYIEDEMKRLLGNYSRDTMQSQKRYLAIICEKETVANILDRVARQYGVPVIYSKGGASIDIRYRLMNDWYFNGEKPMTLLILSDLDPAGYRIQDSFVGSIKADFADWLNGTPVEAYRIGITKDQVRRYQLHSDMDAKESDNGFKKFVKATGMTKAYELDALPPDVLMREVRNAIMQVIDVDLFNQEAQRYNEDVALIEAKKQRVLAALR